MARNVKGSLQRAGKSQQDGVANAIQPAVLRAMTGRRC